MESWISVLANLATILGLPIAWCKKRLERNGGAHESAPRIATGGIAVRLGENASFTLQNEGDVRAGRGGVGGDGGVAIDVAPGVHITIINYPTGKILGGDAGGNPPT